MAQYAFYFNANKCTGCKTCQVACKETYHLPIKNLWRRVYNYVGGDWSVDEEAGTFSPNGVFGYFVSAACNHCAAPACVENCPVGAMQKDPETGIVFVDQELCIGCQTCVNVCPYGAPSFLEEELKSSKCDMCKAKVDAGEKPVCVAACPMRALDFGDRDELIAKYGEGDIEIEPLPKNVTGATTIITPHRNAQKSGEGTGYCVSLPEEI
ncbi:MAG: dimethylsulfoxide reductase subunit B [Coriobacteriales bacterium]|nr:dimethylsulfoxide reductase subunit B [Coriobacteriales bacterium]